MCRSEREGIDTHTAIDLIISHTAFECVAAAAAFECIVSQTARKCICSRFTAQQIIPRIACKYIIPRLTKEAVIFCISREGIRERRTDNIFDIFDLHRPDRCHIAAVQIGCHTTVLRTEIECIAALSAVNPIRTAAGNKRIGTRTARQGIIPLAAIEHIRTFTTLYGIIADTAQ